MLATFAIVAAGAPAAMANGIVEGTVFGPAPEFVTEVSVGVGDPETETGDIVHPEANGHWAASVPAGTYFVTFSISGEGATEYSHAPGAPNYVPEWFEGIVPSFWEDERYAFSAIIPSSVLAIGVSEGKTTSPVNATMVQGGDIEATFTYGPTGETEGCPTIKLFDGASHELGGLGSGFTCSGGEHPVSRTGLLPPGEYRGEVLASSPWAAKSFAVTIHADGAEKAAVVLEPPGSGGGGGETGGSTGGGTSTTSTTTTSTTTTTTTGTGSGATSHVPRPGSSTIRGTQGGATVTLQCVGEAPCTLEVALTSSPTGHAARASSHKPLVIGRGRAVIGAGMTARVPVKFTRTGLKLLRAHHGRIASKLTIKGSGGTAAIYESRPVLVKLVPRK